MDYLYIYISYIIPLCVIIPLIIALVRYRLLTFSFKILFWFLIFSGIANAINTTLSSHHITTTTLFHIYTIFEFAFISLFYLNLFKKSWHKPILILIGAFSLLCMVNFIFIQKGLEFNTYTRSLEAVMIIGYCVAYLNQQSIADTEHNWGSNSLNWINAGILVYYSSGLFMFIASNYLMKHLAFPVYIFLLLDTFLLFEYVLFAIGFYKCRK